MAYSEFELREGFDRDGFVVVRSLLPRSEVLDLRAHAESLVRLEADGRPSSQYVQTAFNAQGAVKLIKASGLAEHDPKFHGLATGANLVDVVETLLGPGARRFRDVLIVQPARTAGPLSYHQDSAYWDVEPKALVSCWIALGDIAQDGGCLRVVPGTHTRSVEHSMYLRGRYEVPRPITRTLRKLVSLAGTGDNPHGTEGNLIAWRAKRWILTKTTKYVPALFDFQDFRVPLNALESAREVYLSVQAGDVVFFHSLLWHASGPNRSDHTRFAEIISFMGASARFVGRGEGVFPLARAR